MCGVGISFFFSIPSISSNHILLQRLQGEVHLLFKEFGTGQKVQNSLFVLLQEHPCSRKAFFAIN